MNRSPPSITALVKNSIGFPDIKQILVTHVHPDHYGMAGRIKKLSGASLAMHHIEKDFIEPRYVNMEPLLQQTDRMLVANGVPEDEMVSLEGRHPGTGKLCRPHPAGYRPSTTARPLPPGTSPSASSGRRGIPPGISASTNRIKKSCSPATISCRKLRPTSACTRSPSKIRSAGI